MLCQSILRYSDQEMVEEYHRSERIFETEDSTIKTDGLIDKNFFRKAPREVMEETIEWLRHRYGSIDAYLDDIGFDETWRQRFRVVVAAAGPTTKL